MQMFDRIDAASLDRREMQLLLLAFTVIFVLVVGMALLMYPTVFSTPVVVSGHTQRKAFFGFCALAVLLLGYLVDRQMMITHLRDQLVQEQEKVARARHEASADLLGTLPHFTDFQDRLAMEYRRASTTQQPLSLVMVVLEASPDFSHSNELSISFGDAAKALMRKLRDEDSMYIFRRGVFCLILPGVAAKDAYLVVGRLTEGLQDASGASSRFSFQIRIFNYPEHATSAREIEQAVRPFAPAEFPDSTAEETKPRPTGFG